MKLKNKLILTFFFIGLMSVNAQQSPPPVAQTIPVKEFKKLLDETPHGVLIDLRTHDEFAAERINNAANIDVQAEDFRERLRSLKKNVPYFLYCG